MTISDGHATQYIGQSHNTEQPLRKMSDCRISPTAGHKQSFLENIIILCIFANYLCTVQFLSIRILGPPERLGEEMKKNMLELPDILDDGLEDLLQMGLDFFFSDIDFFLRSSLGLHGLSRI